jgi:hypothetical protein
MRRTFNFRAFTGADIFRFPCAPSPSPIPNAATCTRGFMARRATRDTMCTLWIRRVPQPSPCAFETRSRNVWKKWRAPRDAPARSSRPRRSPRTSTETNGRSRASWQRSPLSIAVKASRTRASGNGSHHGRRAMSVVALAAACMTLLWSPESIHDLISLRAQSSSIPGSSPTSANIPRSVRLIGCDRTPAPIPPPLCPMAPGNLAQPTPQRPIPDPSLTRAPRRSLPFQNP